MLADETCVPLPTAQKLMGRLAGVGLLESARGTGGGFALARPAASISLADIIEGVEGPIAMTACIEETRHECALEENRSEENTSELQSLMRIPYAVFCLKKKNK